MTCDSLDISIKKKVFNSLKLHVNDMLSFYSD